MPPVTRAATVCLSTVGLIGREHLRLPAFSIPTFSMPLLLFLFFSGASDAPGALGPSMELLGYCGFAVLGVAIFSFGAGLALERVSPWEQFQRTLPVPASLRYGARLAVVLVFSLLSLVPLVAVGLIVSPATAEVVLAPGNAVSLLLGVAVFSALGTALGYWLPVRGAVPLTNLVYLPLGYAAGMLGSAADQRLDRWGLLPTSQWNDLLYGTSVEHAFVLRPLVGLLLWLVLLSVVAVVGYRRVERETFR